MFRKVSARWVPKQQAMRMMTSLDNLQRYKTEGERIVTGDETMGSSLSTGDKAGFKAMETQRITDSDQVQDCALSEQSDGYRVLGYERSIAC